MKSKDILDTIHVTYANTSSVLICGNSKNGISFNIEVSNSSKKKMRSVSVYCNYQVYRWDSTNEFFIENIGFVEKKDAIVSNIELFFSKNVLGYPLDIARSLEIVNKKFDLITNN